MTYPLAIREKAIKLRIEQQLTIDQLAAHLGISRTTIYHWVKDIPIPRVYRTTVPRRLGNRAMQETFRRKREAAYEQGAAEFDELSADPTFRDFVCMYIGEGYKRNRNTVALANSDPAVVVLAARWIRRLASNKVFYAVQYHADQDHDELRRFWSQLLGVSPEDIRLQRKSNSNRLSGRKWRSRHGVLTVGSCDTYLRSRLQAWIDRVERSWL
jgi:AcrR family transcriptional regulator